MVVLVKPTPYKNTMSMTLEDIIRTLDLQPHPEGGYYRETFRDTAKEGERAACTAIYFLLPGGTRSHWHRVDAVEMWHYYAGAPLTLYIADDNGQQAVTLGADITKEERPQEVVPKDAWQSAESTGEWTLVGCTVSPAFEFSGFVMAPEGWEP